MSRLRAINAGLEVLRCGETPRCAAGLARILGEIGIRAQAGKPVRLTGVEQARLKARMISVFGLKPAAFALGRIPEDADRALLASLLADEKISGVRVGGPGRDRTAFSKVLVFIDGAPVAREPEEFAALHPEGIIVVENREVFDRFDRISFPVPEAYRDWLPVFRGSPEWPQDVMQRALGLAGAPVLAFPDLDPAGLTQSLALPGFVDILWPGEEALVRSISEDVGNAERFNLQLAGNRERLEACTHPTVRQIWRILDKYGRVPQQEYFLMPETAPVGA